MNTRATLLPAAFLAGTAMLWLLHAPAFAQEADASPPEKTVLGWLEHIRVLPERTLLRAKLDSGARTSTIHAENITYLERDGGTWVSFSILKDHDDPDSERFSYELPLEREINIKLRYTPERDERPVVLMDICLAGKIYTLPFSLTERSDFNYPVLLGREFLQAHFLVDPASTYTQRTRCRRALQ